MISVTKTIPVGARKQLPLNPYGARLLAGSLVLLTLLVAACRPAGQPVAVDLGLGFAECLPADELTQRQHGEALYPLGTACLERGQPEQARRVAAAISSWQRGALLADTAAFLARQGRTDEATALIGEATAWAQALRDRHREDNLGWTAERVAQHIAVAQSALKQPSQATALLAHGQGRDLDGRLVAQLIQGNPANTFDALQPAIGPLTNDLDMAVQQGLAAGLLGWAESRPDLATNDLTALTAAIQRTWSFQPVAEQIAQRARLATLLTTRGMLAEGTAQRDEATRRAEALPPGYSGAAAAVDLARRLAATDPTAARQQMAAARARAVQCRPVDLPQAHILLIEGWTALGEPGLALEAMHEALRSATALKSPRPRLTACIRICAAVHAAMPTIPPIALRALREQLALEDNRKR